MLDRDASNGAAAAALERLLQQPEHQVVIAEILEPIYLTHGEYQKLIGVHEIQATHASSPERRVQLPHGILNRRSPWAGRNSPRRRSRPSAN